MESGKITLTIESDLAQVQHVGEAVRCLCSHLSLAEVKPSSVEMAVVEAINNSIEHAYASQAGNEIEVAFEYSNDVLNIVISDSGVPMPENVSGLFRKSEIAMPSSAVELECLPESGWGMQLLKTVCDDIEYQRLDNANRLCLSFKLSPLAA